MGEHDDDLESTVEEGADFETDAFPDTDELDVSESDDDDSDAPLPDPDDTEL